MSWWWIVFSSIWTGCVLYFSWLMYTSRKQQSYRTTTHTYKRWSWCCALCFFMLASRQIPWWTHQAHSLTSNSVMVMLDVSQSMLVTDMPANTPRLTAAKTILTNLISLQTSTKRWLGIFAGEAQWVLPLTADTNLFVTFLQWVDHTNIPKQGSNLAEAIRVWTDRFLTSWSDTRVLLLLTDWWETQLTLDESLQKTLQEKQIHLAIIGMWTDTWWPIVQWVDLFGNPILKQRQGQPVISKLEEKTLRHVSKQGNGIYIPWSQRWVAEHIQEYIRSLPRSTTEAWLPWVYEVYRLTGILTLLWLISMMFTLFPSLFFFLSPNKK